MLTNAKLANLLVILPEVRDAKPRTFFLFGLDESQALEGCKMRLPLDLIHTDSCVGPWGVA